MSDFDTRFPDARTKDARPGWPKGVRGISLDGLSQLGIDDEGRLYWDGKPVKTGSQIELSQSQGIGALIVIGSAAVLAVLDLARFLGLGSG